MDTPILIIIVLTAIISFLAWNNKLLFQKLLLSPYIIVHNKQYYRILTHGFVHGNLTHLLVNMLVFWSFGTNILRYFTYIWQHNAIILFVIMYLSSIIVSSIYSVLKNKNNSYYSAVGASGAVSAVVFASVFFDPWNLIYFFGIIPVPGIVFGIIYLVYSYYMSKKQVDNIGHDAHFWGAVYGFVFPLLLKPQLIKHFIYSLFNV